MVESKLRRSVQSNLCTKLFSLLYVKKKNFSSCYSLVKGMQGFVGSLNRNHVFCSIPTTGGRVEDTFWMLSANFCCLQLTKTSLTMLLWPECAHFGRLLNYAYNLFRITPVHGVSPASLKSYPRREGMFSCFWRIFLIVSIVFKEWLRDLQSHTAHKKTKTLLLCTWTNPTQSCRKFQ